LHATEQQAAYNSAVYTNYGNVAWLVIVVAVAAGAEPEMSRLPEV